MEIGNWNEVECTKCRSSLKGDTIFCCEICPFYMCFECCGRLPSDDCLRNPAGKAQQTRVKARHLFPPIGQETARARLTPAALAAAPVGAQKTMIAERLLPAVAQIEGSSAMRVTDMLLELDNSVLLQLLEDRDQLVEMIGDRKRYAIARTLASWTTFE